MWIKNIDVDADLYVDDNSKMSLEKFLKEGDLSIDLKSYCDDDGWDWYWDNDIMYQTDYTNKFSDRI